MCGDKTLHSLAQPPRLAVDKFRSQRKGADSIIFSLVLNKCVGFRDNFFYYQIYNASVCDCRNAYETYFKCNQRVTKYRN